MRTVVLLVLAAQWPVVSAAPAGTLLLPASPVPSDPPVVRPPLLLACAPRASGAAVVVVAFVPAPLAVVMDFFDVADFPLADLVDSCRLLPPSVAAAEPPLVSPAVLLPLVLLPLPLVTCA